MSFINSPLSGFLLCCLTYYFGVWLQKKTKFILFNPILVSMVLTIIIMKLTGYTLEQYNNGTAYLTFFLLPATGALALNIYRQRAVLKKFYLPVVLGCLAGSGMSILSTIVLCKLFGIDTAIENSLVPKSITTAIAIDVSNQLHGVIPITIICVMVSGLVGAIFLPTVAKKIAKDDSIAVGIAIGTSSHILGTTKAIEMGEVEGAMSSVAISISGLITVLLILFL